MKKILLSILCAIVILPACSTTKQKRNLTEVREDQQERAMRNCKAWYDKLTTSSVSEAFNELTSRPTRSFGYCHGTNGTGSNNEMTFSSPGGYVQARSDSDWERFLQKVREKALRSSCCSDNVEDYEPEYQDYFSGSNNNYWEHGEDLIKNNNNE